MDICSHNQINVHKLQLCWMLSCYKCHTCQLPNLPFILKRNDSHFSEQHVVNHQPTSQDQFRIPLLRLDCVETIEDVMAGMQPSPGAMQHSLTAAVIFQLKVTIFFSLTSPYLGITPIIPCITWEITFLTPHINLFKPSCIIDFLLVKHQS